jgi:hypothetical protein
MGSISDTNSIHRRLRYFPGLSNVVHKWLVTENIADPARQIMASSMFSTHSEGTRVIMETNSCERSRWFADLSAIPDELARVNSNPAHSELNQKECHPGRFFMVEEAIRCIKKSLLPWDLYGLVEHKYWSGPLAELSQSAGSQGLPDRTPLPGKADNFPKRLAVTDKSQDGRHTPAQFLCQTGEMLLLKRDDFGVALGDDNRFETGKSDRPFQNIAASTMY